MKEFLTFAVVLGIFDHSILIEEKKELIAVIDRSLLAQFEVVNDPEFRAIIDLLDIQWKLIGRYQRFNITIGQAQL